VAADVHESAIEALLAEDTGSIPALIRMHATARPARLALVAAGGERTGGAGAEPVQQAEQRPDQLQQLDYAGFDALMDRVAAALQRDGLAPGDVIAIAADSSLEYIAVYLGAIRAGVCVAPLQPNVTPDSLAAMIADCGARLLFVDDRVTAVLARAAQPPSAPRVALTGLTAGRPLGDWLAREASVTGARVVPAGAPFNIIYSSGTTGTPKGIVQSHAMRWAHVRRGGKLGYGPTAVSLMSTGLYSNTTLVSLFPTLALGGTAVVLARFSPAAFLAAAAHHRVSHAMLVPVQYDRILRHPDFDRTDLSSFRMKFCTSAPFSAALKAEVLRRWPGGLIEYFGMTEGGGTCILIAHDHPDKLHTVGKAGDGYELRAIDDAGHELGPGEVGEIVGHSQHAVMTGYHNRPDATAAAEWHDASGRRFIRTGDLGSFDPDGFLTIVGRKKDVIISGGFNIYPIDLEAALLSHPAVAEAAVVGVPSSRWGETPVAFVVLASSQVSDAHSLREHANVRLGSTQRLADVVIVSSLPRSTIGKVLKRELRELYAGPARS
jgi:acyl-CoA synthetase (AMP-forming)/AMP-acid ligase II